MPDFHSLRSPPASRPRRFACNARILWAFCRPHTIIGTALAVLTLYLVAAKAADRHDLSILIVTAAASLAVNVYVVGLNQLTDVQIDRINKPHLPLAAGTLSPKRAGLVVGSAGVAALSLALCGGPWLLVTISTVLALGTAYSLPPARLRRYPMPAALSIALARGVVGNLGVYLTYSSVLGGQTRLPAHVIAFTTFMCAFMIVIAILKDAPDAEGDRAHGVRTFALQLGSRRVVGMATSLLAILYVGMIALGLGGGAGLHRGVTVVGHLAALTVLALRVRRCNPDERQSLSRLYGTIWVLFYLEFGLYGAASCLAEPP